MRDASLTLRAALAARALGADRALRSRSIANTWNALISFRAVGTGIPRRRINEPIALLAARRSNFSPRLSGHVRCRHGIALVFSAFRRRDAGGGLYFFRNILGRRDMLASALCITRCAPADGAAVR